MASLERFVEAQDPVYRSVLDELRSCRKATHWMWFVFPQLKGLGRSATARFYGLDGRQEAQRYLRHDVLGARLVECTRAVLDCRDSVHRIFGTPDDLKFVSCMTLFEAVSSQHDVFGIAIERFCEGRRDRATLDLLDMD